MTIIKNVTEEKKLKNLIGFHRANKIYNRQQRRGERWRGGEKKSKRVYRTSQNTRLINVFL